MDIYVIDGTYELFRYFYAVPSAQDTGGQEIGAVRGVLGSFLSLIHFKKVEAVNYGTTFRKQAEQWLKHVQMRNRKPIAPATATSWESCLDVWLNPHLGGMPLSSINNPEVKQLVAKMVVAGLSAKSVNNADCRTQTFTALSATMARR
jgi:Phage integrase central domain